MVYRRKILISAGQVMGELLVHEAEQPQGYSVAMPNLRVGNGKETVRHIRNLQFNLHKFEKIYISKCKNDHLGQSLFYALG